MRIWDRKFVLGVYDDMVAEIKVKNVHVNYAKKGRTSGFKF